MTGIKRKNGLSLVCKHYVSSTGTLLKAVVKEGTILPTFSKRKCVLNSSRGFPSVTPIL